MVAVQQKWARWFLVVFVFTFVLECIPEKAEAARRGGGLFGRRASRSGGRRRARVARGGRRNQARQNVNRNRNRNFNNNFNNDAFGLDIEPVNGLANLALDPSGDLQRLAAFSNLAVSRNGQLFELNNGNILDRRQPLILVGGQVVGGAFGGMQNETLQQIRLLNETGNFRTRR